VNALASMDTDSLISKEFGKISLSNKLKMNPNQMSWKIGFLKPKQVIVIDEPLILSATILSYSMLSEVLIRSALELLIVISGDVH
jgi:hypothetical protein